MSATVMGCMAVLCGGLCGDLELPPSSTARPVKDTEFFEVTMDATGAMSVGDEAKSLGGFQVALAIWRQMVKGSDEEGGFCAHPLRIRADQRAEARYVQKLLAVAGLEDLKVYRIQLMTAAAEDGDEAPTALKYYLPKDVGVRDRETIEEIEVHIRRNRPRAKEDFRFDAKDLGIHLGPSRMDDLAALKSALQKAFRANPQARLTLYPYAGTLTADLYEILGVAYQAGFALPGIAGAPKDR